jgi:CDP-diglyceride synthetase
MSIAKRGLTIAIGAPIAIAMTLNNVGVTVLVWAASFLAMVEWTALKRHLKVVLLASVAKEAGARHTTPPPEVPSISGEPVSPLSPAPEEYPKPVAQTNTFILVKCFLSTLPVPCCLLSQPDYFHFAVTCYFFFWVVFTLTFQNKLENTAFTARKRVESDKALTAAETAAEDERQRQGREFSLRELSVIATSPVTDNFLSFALEYFGFAWVLGLSSALLLYHHIPRYGAPVAITVLVANWANDAMALIVGKSLKGHTKPLYPRISPNKSREGAIAGVIANGGMAALMAWGWPALSELDWGKYPAPALFFAAGLLAGVLGVIGDLLQSLFKRTARVKDTGGLLPGHGGILDRIDGLLLTFPYAYWLLWAFLHGFRL